MKRTSSEANVLASDGSRTPEHRMSLRCRVWPAASHCYEDGHQLDQGPRTGSHAPAAPGCGESPLDANRADGSVR